MTVLEFLDAPKYLLSTYYVLGVVPGAENTAMREAETLPTWHFTFCVRTDDTQGHDLGDQCREKFVQIHKSRGYRSREWLEVVSADQGGPLGGDKM